jgi:hypothetical protein
MSGLRAELFIENDSMNLSVRAVMKDDGVLDYINFRLNGIWITMNAEQAEQIANALTESVSKSNA